MRKHFTLLLREKFPEFSQDKTATVPPGTCLYRWDAAAELTFFLFLILSPKDDEFTVEAAWAEGSHFPSSNLLSTPYGEPSNGALRFRIGALWENPTQSDRWWRLSPERTLDNLFLPEETVEACMTKVIPAVTDAINHIANNVTPYFHNVAQSKGYELMKKK